MCRCKFAHCEGMYQYADIPRIGELPTHVSICFPEHADSANVLEELPTDLNDGHDHGGASNTDGYQITEHHQAGAGKNYLSPLGALTRAVYQPSITELESTSHITRPHQGSSSHHMVQRPASQPEPENQSRTAICSEPYNSTPNLEVRHPMPRHFASHPVLADRAPAKVVTKSSSSPELPPRSPLRLHCGESSVPACNVASSVSGEPHPGALDPVHSVTASKPKVSKTTVNTECSGPVTTQQTSPRTRKSSASAAIAKKDRESRRQRSRRPREKDINQASIDSILCHSRDHPLSARMQPGSFGQKLTEGAKNAGITLGNSDDRLVEPNVETVTVGLFGPASMHTFGADENDHRPDSPTTPCTRAEQFQRPHEARLRSQPDVNSRYTNRHSLRPTGKGASREVKSFAPRPRSAQRTAHLIKNRGKSSRTSQRMSSSEHWPAPTGMTQATRPSRVLDDDFDLIGPFSPKFASEPPRKALPPTPSGSSRSTASRTRSTTPLDSSSDEGSSGYETIATTPCSTSRCTTRTPHVASQAQRDPPQFGPSRVDARLEALEKQNALLSAALMAVLKTNGALNSPLTTDDFDHNRNPPANNYRSTERTRRKPSKSKHAINDSAGSAHALDMYMHSRNMSAQ